MTKEQKLLLDTLENHPRKASFERFTLMDVLNLNPEEFNEFEDAMRSVEDETLHNDLIGVADWLDNHRKIVIDI